VAYNQTLLVNVTALNTLDTANILPNSTDYNGVQFNPVCNFGPVTAEVIQGHYTAKDFSNGTVVSIHGPQIYMCVTLGYPLTSYTFQPKSDVFTGPSSLGAGQNVTRAAAVSIQVNQDWSEVHSSHQPLPAGEYTVVAADAWGQLALAYFTVG